MVETPHPAMTDGPQIRNPHSVFFLLSLAGAFLLYGVALEAPFYLDDQLVAETAMTNIGNRPLGFWTFRLSRHIADLLLPFFPWGTTFYYRFPNILIHAAAATAVFWLAREILRSNGRAALAGALFLVHPVQTQAITYVSQRFEALAAFFMICSAAAFIRYRRSNAAGWAVACFLFGAGALLSKETAVALPLWLVFIEIVFFSKGRLPRPTWRWLPPALVFAVFLDRSVDVMGGMFNWIPWHEYWLAQGPVLATYLKLLVYPAHQYLIYDFVPGGVPSPIWILQWLGVLAVAGCGLALLRRRSAVGFGIATFFILLLPVTVLPIPDLIFEHRVYPGLAGIALAAAAAAPARIGRVSGAVIAGLLVLLSARTVVRNAEWSDPLAFYEAHVRAFPREPRVLTFLAGMHFSRGEVNRSLEEMLAARENEDRVNLYYSNSTRTSIAMNLAIAYSEKGELRKAREEARKAVTFSPREAGALRVLGQVQLELGESEAARETFERMTKIKPEMIDGWVGLHQASLLLGDAEAAEEAKALGTGEQEKQRSVADQRLRLPAEYRTWVTFAAIFLFVTGVVFGATFLYTRLRNS